MPYHCTTDKKYTHKHLPVVQTNRITGLDRILISEQGYDLPYLVNKVKYNFDFSDDASKKEFDCLHNHQSKNIKEQDKLENIFTDVIRIDLKGETYKILWKSDESLLYHRDKQFVVRLVHESKGFQVFGKSLVEAINNMADHLYYKVAPRNQASVSGRPIWNQIFKGECYFASVFPSNPD